MSFQSMAWAIKKNMGHKEKLVLLICANYADEDGVCWPSLSRLSSDTGLSKASICRTLTNLEELGLIERQRRVGDRGDQSSLYRLKMDGEGVSHRDTGGVSQGDRGCLTQRHYTIKDTIKDNKARAERLRPDWYPSADGLAFAQAELGDGWVETLDFFRDYWIAQPGVRGVKLDWDATWRNWVRRQDRKKQPRQLNQKKSVLEIAREMMDVETHSNSGFVNNLIQLPRREG